MSQGETPQLSPAAVALWNRAAESQARADAFIKVLDLVSGVGKWSHVARVLGRWLIGTLIVFQTLEWAVEFLWHGVVKAFRN